MGIMDNEGHDPRGFGNTPKPADELRQAAIEVLDIFDQGDTSEAWQVAMLKLRTALGIVGRTYEQSKEDKSWAA